MASKKVKGTKESKNAKKQTYAKVVQDSTSQMPTQSSSKSRSQVKSKKDDKPHSEPRTESAKQMEINANCDTDEQISFFYGNPFNEMVKGILHIVSEKYNKNYINFFICKKNITIILTLFTNFSLIL